MVYLSILPTMIYSALADLLFYFVFRLVIIDSIIAVNMVIPMMRFWINVSTIYAGLWIVGMSCYQEDSDPVPRISLVNSRFQVPSSPSIIHSSSSAGATADSSSSSSDSSLGFAPSSDQESSGESEPEINEPITLVPADSSVLTEGRNDDHEHQGDDNTRRRPTLRYLSAPLSDGRVSRAANDPCCIHFPNLSIACPFCSLSLSFLMTSPHLISIPSYPAFDYLFSPFPLVILPQEVLESKRKGERRRTLWLSEIRSRQTLYSASSLQVDCDSFDRSVLSKWSVSEPFLFSTALVRLNLSISATSSSERSSFSWGYNCRWVAEHQPGRRIAYHCKWWNGTMKGGKWQEEKEWRGHIRGRREWDSQESPNMITERMRRTRMMMSPLM